MQDDNSTSTKAGDRAADIRHTATMTQISPKQANAWLEQYFAEWVRAPGLEITAINPESCTMIMQMSPAILRHGGIVSGQALAMLADTAMVFACAGHAGDFMPVATSNLETRFLRPASGENIRCDATVVRAGRSVIFAEASMTDEPSGKLVARASATFIKT
jgi:uncharacterized protein (TIGR00369 family)